MVSLRCLHATSQARAQLAVLRSADSHSQVTNALDWLQLSSLFVHGGFVLRRQLEKDNDPMRLVGLSCDRLFACFQVADLDSLPRYAWHAAVCLCVSLYVIVYVVDHLEIHTASAVDCVLCTAWPVKRCCSSFLCTLINRLINHRY